MGSRPIGPVVPRSLPLRVKTSRAGAADGRAPRRAAAFLLHSPPMETTAPISAQQRSGAGAVLDAAVIVAALGYLVDIYDLILVSIVRRPSLTALGVAGDALVSEGVSILNWRRLDDVER